MRIPAILLCLLAALVFAKPAHSAALNLQTCTVTPTTGGIAGCPAANALFGPVAPTTLVRSQPTSNGPQGWRAFSSLKSTDQVYAQDHAWHTLSTVQPSLAQTPAPGSPPVVTPPADQWIALNWTCSIANNTATCTAPLMTVSP